MDLTLDNFVNLTIEETYRNISKQPIYILQVTMSQHMLKHHIGEVSEVIDSKESHQSVVHSVSCSALLPEPAAAPSQRATSLDNQLGDFGHGLTWSMCTRSCGIPGNHITIIYINLLYILYIIIIIDYIYIYTVIIL